MTGRISSQNSGGGKAGTSKNALLNDSTKSGNITDDEHDKWSQSTVSFDFDKMHADDFPNFLNDEFSIHKNDEALLADFTALLEDGDDAGMTTNPTASNIPEKELNKSVANMSASTSRSANSSTGEVLVATVTRNASEQSSQNIGSIMSDHDYLSRADILEIMHHDEENFFAQGYVKPIEIKHDSMEVNLSDFVPPTLASQSSIESADTAAATNENGVINETSAPMTSANVPDDATKTILTSEITPILVKLTTTEPTEKEKLIETISELEEKMAKLKKSLTGGTVEASTDDKETVAVDAGDNSGEPPAEPPTMSECSDSDAIFSCGRSEPFEYYGMPKEPSTPTTDDSDDEFVSKLKTELNTADALNNELRLIINSYRRDIAPSTAQTISIKLANHLVKITSDLLKITSKFEPVSTEHVPSSEKNENGSAKSPNAVDSNEKSEKRLLAEFSSSSSSEVNSSDDEAADVLVKRKKKSRGSILDANDPSLSQINGVDDDDNILVKNEPLLSSQFLNGDADTSKPTKIVNVIEELKKWNDMENEGEFYGFDATDTDECANSSIEIGAKTEPESVSTTNSENEKAIDGSEDTGATEEYSVLDEIAKMTAAAAAPAAAAAAASAAASAPASLKINETENSTKTIDDGTDIKEANEIKTAGSKSVDDDTAADVTDDVEDSGALVERLQNGKDSSSENDASDEGGEDDDDDDDTDEDEDNDREIARLLDFSSLGIKRKISAGNNPPNKINGTDEPKKPNKKQKKGDGLDAILRQPHDNSDDSDGESSKSEEEDITEEQYLKQHNLNLKNQMLADTSESESDYDSDADNDDPLPKMNGKRKKANNSDGEDDSDASGSYESLVDQFLEKDAAANETPEKKSTTDSQPKTSIESDADKSDASPNSKSSKSPTPSVVNGSVASEEKCATIAIANNKEAETDDKDDDESVDRSSDSADSPKRKSKTIIGAKLFANIEKELRPLISSDDSDANDDDSTKSKKKASMDDSSDDCEVILDMSLFKNRKKDIDSKQLSKILNNSAKAKTSTSRETPDECISLSSDDDLELAPISTENADAKEASEDDDEGKNKNRTGRKLLRTDQLAGETKRAQREETDRVKRLEKKQTRLSQIIESQREKSQSQRTTQGDDGPAEIENIILDYDSKKKENIIVHRDIQKHLKEHQIDGIRFMYDSCYGSVDSINAHPGSGCILAHCMGLGKTLQLISLLHTVISYPQLKTNRVLVICPKSTVLNWKEEIERWMGPIKDGRRLKLFQFADQCDIKVKLDILREWSRCGSKANSRAGCLLLGYEAFRTLVFYHQSARAMKRAREGELDAIKKMVSERLLDPGADLVICDEGHMIKNQKSTTSMAVNKIRTERRIILTGTPIQNNLKEYYSMVNFIKPSFLGTEKEFNNLYGNPIKSGQHKDSSKSDIKIMKQRSYVLHKKLSKFVQRREAALLRTFLPEKYEYVIFIPMTVVQNGLYEYFLENNPLKDKLGGKSLISDYTILRKIWTHPKVLENAYLNALREEQRKNNKLMQRRLNNEEEEEERPDDFLDSQEGKMSVKNDWWRPHVTKVDLETILPSNKLKILFEILKVCHENKEKCLIFSAFVAVLDVVEFFMKQISKQTQEGVTYQGLENYRGMWKFAEDYYRLDGKTPRSTRHQMITNFNDPKNVRARVFLISAKAGGQGINLTGANRVVLLDTSWNPSNDQQNIFRVFRLGQKKICYVYRLLAMGTMEEKVYSRSVTKQAMSYRVVDEQQIDRHYNMAELTELYTLIKPDYSQRATPTLPADKLLAHLLHTFPNLVYKYHNHDSLLEKNNEQDLSEEEKADAWQAYERDVTMRNSLSNMGSYNQNFQTVPGYDNNFASYHSLYGSAFSGGGYGTTNSSVMAYLNQLSTSSFSSTDYQAELMRMYSDYSNPYANYPGMYAGNTSAAASLYNSALLSSPPPPPTTPSSATSPAPSMLGYNQMGARNVLGSSASAAAGYNTNSNYLSSLVQSTSTSKNYTNSMLGSSAMQMYLNSYANSSSGGSRIPAPVSSPLTNTSKTTASTASSLFDPNILSYLQQNSLLYSGSSATANSAGMSSSSSTNLPTNTATNTTNGAGSNTSSRQGPNAKRNPMLSKELSVPSLMPRTPFFDSLNLPSVQTSVITKSTVSPSATSTSTSTTTTAASGDLSSKKNQALGSPEPHIIVKNVNAINQTIVKSTIPPKNGNSTPSPNSGQMSNKNSVSITTINKKPNTEMSSIASTNSSSSSSNRSNNNSTSTSTSGASNNSSTTSVPNLIKTNADKSNTSTRSITNMGIVYPEKERASELDKPTNSPTPKIVNMGIVYPPTSKPPASNASSNVQINKTISTKSPSDANTTKPTAHNHLMNSKNSTTTASRTSTPAETPMTALAAVNKVLQQQNQRRTSPGTSQPVISKPTSSLLTPIKSSTSSPTFPRKMINTSSVTVTPVTVASKPATSAVSNTSNTSITKSTTSNLSLNKRVPTLNNSITLSPITTTPTGSQYKTFGRPMQSSTLISPTPDKDAAIKNISPKIVLSKPNATWQSRSHSMTISKTSVPAVVVPPSVQPSNQNTINGIAPKPRILTVTSKPNTTIQQQSQQRSSPVIVRSSPTINQTNNNRPTASPTTVRRVIIGPGSKQAPLSPQIMKPVTVTSLNTQTSLTRPIASAKGIAVNKLPTLKNDTNVPGTLANRKRTASPISGRPPNSIVGSNSVSITQVKKPKLSLSSPSNPARPPPIVRTMGAPVRKPTANALQNIRVLPRQPNNTTNNNNNSQSEYSQRNVQGISTMEIVELD